MKLFTLIFCLLLSLSSFAQKPDDVLATATGRTWTIKDLSPEAREAHTTFPAKVANVRKQLLSQMLGESLIEIEAKSRNISPQAVVKAEAKKVKDPTPAEIKTVYDLNQDKLGGKTLEQVRSQIIEYMRHDPEEKALAKFVDTLALKYKVVYGKDINAAGLKPTDVLYSITGGQLTVKEFDDANRLTLYSFGAEFYDGLKAETEAAVFDALVIEEAKALKMDAGDLIAREVTGKMKDFTDAERDGLEAAFRTKLFTKYVAKILVAEPAAPVQTISVDDDPARGPANGPVTIIMFSDFQCSACSATHPVLKEAMVPYADKIRFVVRDFPLEGLHENAFRAALAANAANAQGKFFEYTEILYKNQEALDDASLKKYAADLGLNAAQFALDLNSEKTAAEVRKDMAEGKTYGINGTPAIFVNGRFVRRLSPAGFKNAIENALKNSQ
ncbi:MAG: thioredoxin domain-containing protein [Pyrinomonadaceae bacterium]